jgi:hypothetical protein
MNDLEFYAWHVLAFIGFTCFGIVLGSWDARRRRLPHPDPRSLRSRCEY